MRWCTIGMFAVLLSSCREIQPLDSRSAIQGYQLEGTVTSSNGIPVDGVDVRLYYSYQYISATRVDTQIVRVTDPTRPVGVSVYSSNFNFVRELFLGYMPVGVVPRWPWDGNDQNGNPVPSGKYLVRYSVDTAIVKFSPVIVEGHITVKSDAAGEFILNSRFLPIGERFDLYDQFEQFAGAYQVLPRIHLTLRKGNVHATYRDIPLTRNTITRNVFTIQ